LPNLSDIARLASVSLPTASLALSNHPRVADRTKLRVIEAASSLGYVPNQAARRLVRSKLSQRTEAFDQVGFICFDRVRPRVDVPGMSILCGAEQELSTYGASVLFVRLSPDSGKEKIERLLRAGWVDGWIVEGLVDDELLTQLQSPRVPCVIVGAHRCKKPVHSVDADYAKAGRLAAEHLAALGHRRVAFISGSMRHHYQWELLSGFRETARELGLDGESALIQHADPVGNEPMHVRLKRALALRPMPTAVFTAEPGFAVQAMNQMREAGFLIPDTVSVLGCEVDGGYCTEPSLARVELPLGAVGHAAASLLHELVRKGKLPAQHVSICPNIVQGTTGRPARGVPVFNPVATESSDEASSTR
jgi:LacI family transcriptional regulator